ncbi:MAG: hypothetical protein J3Q66DRAFT_327149 [Benniella sp.]|nr:MAG: hypothetical protein J3Q66DRAFT_327149 [Benniella sp.]
MVLPSTKITVCSFAVALSLLTLVAVSRSNSFLHPHHQPILSGALFPSHAPTPPVKQPCPNECIQHKSGLYLAVTSIGHGFPRVQYTCTDPHHPQATDSACSSEQRTFLSHSPQHVHDPADPTPEQTPTPLFHRHDQRLEAHSDEGALRSTSYFDLQITQGVSSSGQLSPSQGSVPEHPMTTMTVMDYTNLGFTGNAAQYQSHYGFVFSPRERAFEEELSTSHQHSHQHHHEAKIVTRMPFITPEAAVSLPAPTSMGDDSHWRNQGSSRTAHHDGETNTAGPPSPTPEPLIGQPETGVDIEPNDKTRGVEKKHVNSEGKSGDEGRIRKILHRVTTLIIETETVIAPPRKTRPTVGPQLMRIPWGQQQQHHH